MNEVANVNDLKSGITFFHRGNVFVVISSSHSKAGRGQAVVKTKAKNLNTGSIVELSFTGGDKIERAFVEKREMNYLYSSNDESHFIDNKSFEQVLISSDKIKRELKFLIEGATITAMLYENSILNIELPKNVILEIIETADAVKGDTVTTALKKGTTNTLLEIDIPQFINQGQKIVVSTTTGKYVSRSS